MHLFAGLFLAGLGGAAAQAQSLTFDVRLDDGGNQKARTVSVGDVLTLQVYGVVAGTDTLNNEGFQSGWGSVLSTGSGTSVGGNLSTATLAAPFNAVGSQTGTVQDLNGDGFADVGSNSTSQNTDFLFARASGMQTNGTRIGANTEEFLLGTITYTVTAAGDSSTTGINFRITDFTPVNERIALFQADGTTRNELNATINVGSAVLLSAGPADAYWTGDQTNTWSTDNLGNTNWATDLSGATDAGVLPGTATNVYFNANGGTNLSTELGRDFSIRSLNFTANATTPVTIASGGAGNFKLTIGAGGVNVAAGSGAHTISAGVVLNGAQDWTINTHPATELTVSGTVSGGNTATFRKKGTGTLTLTGNNTFTGDFEVHAGRAILAGTGAAGATSHLKVIGGSLELGGTTTNRINNTARVTLFNNTKLVRLFGASEATFTGSTVTGAGMGTLGLSGDATLDFGNWGADVGTLAFADFEPQEFTLTIDNWTGVEAASRPQNYSPSSLTDDRLIFATDQSANLTKFVFVGYTGAQQIALGNGLYEIIPDAVFTPIPEASTVYICLALLGVVAWRQRRSLRGIGRWWSTDREAKEI